MANSNQRRPTLATIAQVEDLEERVTNTLMGVLARIEILEHVVSSVIQDLYVDESPDVPDDVPDEPDEPDEPVDE